MYIWEHPHWPRFEQDWTRLADALAETRHAQGERIAAGLCPNCGVHPPVPERRLCAGCGERKRAAERERYARRKAESRCVRCREPVPTGTYRCRRCAAMEASRPKERKNAADRKRSARRRASRSCSRARSLDRRGAPVPEARFTIVEIATGLALDTFETEGRGHGLAGVSGPRFRRGRDRLGYRPGADCVVAAGSASPMRLAIAQQVARICAAGLHGVRLRPPTDMRPELDGMRGSRPRQGLPVPTLSSRRPVRAARGYIPVWRSGKAPATQAQDDPTLRPRPESVARMTDSERDLADSRRPQSPKTAMTARIGSPRPTWSGCSASVG